MQKFISSKISKQLKNLQHYKCIFPNLPTRIFHTLDQEISLTDDQKAIQGTASDFANKFIAPYAAQWDQNHHFPAKVLSEAAKLGFTGIYVKSENGGCQLGRLEASLIFEALAAADVPTAAYLSVQNMCSWIIDTFGSEEQQKQYVPSLMKFEKSASYCLTEPQSGSDSASMSTIATKNGGDYILNGTKCFISGGSVSDLYIVMCKTSDKDISSILVEKGTKGLSFGKLEEKMGWNMDPTTMVYFENCRVPLKNLLGHKEGQGFKHAMAGLDSGRVNIASCSLGGAAFCYDTAKEYMKHRKQFGVPLKEFQYLAFKLADMATNLTVSRELVRKAARMIDLNHKDKGMYAAMAKKFASDHCFEIVNQALQIHGGYGYLKDYPIERYFRDLRVNQILEGTNEIMRLIISRKLLKEN